MLDAVGAPEYLKLESAIQQFWECRQRRGVLPPRQQNIKPFESSILKFWVHSWSKLILCNWIRPTWQSSYFLRNQKLIDTSSSKNIQTFSLQIRLCRKRLDRDHEAVRPDTIHGPEGVQITLAQIQIRLISGIVFRLHRRVWCISSSRSEWTALEADDQHLWYLNWAMVLHWARGHVYWQVSMAIQLPE